MEQVTFLGYVTFRDVISIRKDIDITTAGVSRDSLVAS